MTNDKMSMTKSHGGITVNENYQLNNLYIFTNQKRIELDNNNVKRN